MFVVLLVLFVLVLRVIAMYRAIVPVLCFCYCYCSVLLFVERVRCSCSLLLVRCSCALFLLFVLCSLFLFLLLFVFFARDLVIGPGRVMCVWFCSCPC